MLDISGDVKVELGKKVFGHCEHIAHKTVGLDVVSHGTVGLGLNFTASDAHVEKVWKIIRVGMPYFWGVAVHVVASHVCRLCFGGLLAHFAFMLAWLQSVNGTGFDLVFDFECNTVGLVLSWNVQEVTANNCKLKILGGYTLRSHRSAHSWL